MRPPAAYLRYLRETTVIDGDYSPPMAQIAGERVDLERALGCPRLVIVGPPGSGKTTFLRHLAFLLVRGLEDTQTDSLPFPIFLGVGELAACGSPQSIVNLLNERSRELGWDVPENYFGERLVNGLCVLLLDGLEEAPDVGRLIQKTPAAFPHSRFVVTSRPVGRGEPMLIRGFDTVWIEAREP